MLPPVLRRPARPLPGFAISRGTGALLWVLFLSLLVAEPITATPTTDACYRETECYSVRSDISYDAVNNLTTFSYRLCFTNQGSCQNELSNVAFSLPCGVTASQVSGLGSTLTFPYTPETSPDGRDPACGTNGLAVKFNTSKGIRNETGGCATFTYSVTGDYRNYGPVVRVKYGNTTRTFDRLGQCCPQLDVTCPADVTLQCGGSTDPADTGKPKTEGGCGSITTSYTDHVTANCGNSKTIVRTWIIQEGDKLVKTCKQTITVEDRVKPTVTAPADVTIACTDPLPGDLATATDNCDAHLAVTYADAVTSGEPTTGCYVITRTFSATDDCGNTGTATQIITVQDRVKPTVTAPDDVTITCTDDENDPHLTGTASATDNCDDHLEVIYSDAVTGGDPTTGCYVITRTFSATDDCGNTGTATQIITVEDKVKPTVTAPADVTIACTDDENDPHLTGTASATDNCDDHLAVTYTDAVTGGDPTTGCYVITRTFSATDDCGNTGTATQTITVEDKVRPVFLNCPADMTVSCTEEIPPVAQPMAEDNCDPHPMVEYNGEVADYDCGGGDYTLTRTWTATDNCGNVTVCEQVITVRTRLYDPCYSIQLNREYDAATNRTTFTWELCLIGDKCKDLSNIRFSIPCDLPKSALLSASSSVAGVKSEISGNPRRCDRGYFVVFENFADGALKMEPNQCARFTYTLQGDLRDYLVDVPIKAGTDTGLGFTGIGTTCDCDGSDLDAPVVYSTPMRTARSEQAPEGLTALELFPNPVADDLTVRFASAGEQRVLVQVFSATGQLQLSRELSVVAGDNQVAVSLAGLPGGLYRLLLTPQDGERQARPFIRIHH